MAAIMSAALAGLWYDDSGRIFFAKPSEDGDHFVLRGDRLLTESSLEAVIESVKKCTNLENKEIVTDVSPDRMDLSNESLIFRVIFVNYYAIMELRSGNKIGEALLTGSQCMATRVATNPSSVIPNVSRTGLSQMDTQRTDGIGSATFGLTDLTRDHTAFGESATNLPNSGPDGSLNYKTHNIDDVAKLFGVPLNSSRDIEEFIQDLHTPKGATNDPNADNNLSSKVSPSDPIIRSVDINAKSTSYAGAAGVSAKDQPKSNFRPLVVDPVFNGVNISILRKVVEKVSTHFEQTLYSYFIGKRMVFPVVDYYAINNWAKHGLKKIMMNSKGFFFFKFDSRAGLEAVLEGGPWMILFEEDGISLIATFIGKPVMLDSYTSSMCNDSWGRSSFVRCLIEVDSEADLVDVDTIGIPSHTKDDFTKETIRVEYEWRPPRCDQCKIFGHVYDHCPKKVVSPPIIATSNVTPPVVKTNDGFQTVGKKKKKGKSKSTNGGQFVGPSVKVRYEPKVTTSEPKKGSTNVGNASKSSSMLKSTGTPSKEGNITTSNSYSALEDNEEDDEDHVENVYDESANLFPNSKAGETSSFTAAAG
ncbi:zinc knuckle CX2CX4HX4C containing protein [Tanacetum coccineum]